ncbi:hypothetical protein [Streptomyces rimosus]|uniref:hypothetical protein n=1 Tax=Streptomyces rimosus TaxID=1927 RepID=UPI0037CCF9FF
MERTGRQRLPSLTGLRFLLALPVLVSHLLVDVALFADADVHTALYPSQTLAACAVSGFFVLSGFVLAWTHRPGEPVALSGAAACGGSSPPMCSAGRAEWRSSP